VLVAIEEAAVSHVGIAQVRLYDSGSPFSDQLSGSPTFWKTRNIEGTPKLFFERGSMMMRLKLVLPFFGFAALLFHPGSAGAQTCGSAYFSDPINWQQNPTLYYTVSGAPANTCGDLWASRNGSAYTKEAAGWICTDASGNATKGPWYWSNQADDETGYAFIEWPAPYSCLSPTRKHIWDVDPPTVAITTCGPSSYSGTAADDAWGAGFDSEWTGCFGGFYDETSDRWWSPVTGNYSETAPAIWNCTCSGVPSLNITWSCSTRPTSHTSGHHYVWYALSWDGGQASLPDTCSFTF
jgi:hypothetical protein